MNMERFYAKLIAYWRLHRSRCFLVSIVISLQIGFGVWQCYDFATSSPDQAAFGWGVALAKGCAGALYPTMFGLILSMSRWTATFMCDTKCLSALINWDEYRNFHIRMAICTYVLACLHIFGHMAGTFVHASKNESRTAVMILVGTRFEAISYKAFMTSLPGWTGMVALLMLSCIAVASSPFIKRFEIFQMSHLLIYPILGLLAAHGTSHLLQEPVLGIVLALPTFLICVERIVRCWKTCHGYTAFIQQFDQDIVKITLSKGCLDRPKAGQYCLIRLTKISSFQWHPFSISHIDERGLPVLFAKQSGDWTRALSVLSQSCIEVNINVDGPFRAPAQHFHQYDHILLVATGIGITPYASVLSLLARDRDHPWVSESYTRKGIGDWDFDDEKSLKSYQKLPRYIHICWSTRTSNLNMIFWLIGIISAISSSAKNDMILPRVSIHLTDATSEQCNQMPSIPMAQIAALLTDSLEEGIATCRAKRPVLSEYIKQHYQIICDEHNGLYKQGKRTRIGVFICGNPAVKKELGKLCLQQTTDSILDGREIEYHFRPEIF